MTPTKARGQLRGHLKPKRGPGARGLEHMARNPACERLQVLTAVGVGPNMAANEILGERGLEGQSPFALVRGNSFERYVLAEGGARLLELYRREGRVDVAAGPFVDVRAWEPAGLDRAEQSRRRRAITARLLEGAGRQGRPAIVAHAVLGVEVAGASFDIEADYLVADGGGFYLPGEIKSYADKASKTDPADLQGACRQAAVAVVALRQARRRLGLGGGPRAACDLVLRKAGTNWPTLRAMTLEGEVDSIERALAAAPRLLVEAAARAGGASLGEPEVLASIPNHYVEECREFCALARRCKRDALAAADPALLGDRAREQLAPVSSLVRMARFVQGDDAPASDAERASAARLRRVVVAYRKALQGT
ncbi:MAG: hypothetical protein MUF34_07475 [Polyangiaceae bacterium]|nr:hypothetical protein [Polyangiaceae bacterium]